MERGERESVRALSEKACARDRGERKRWGGERELCCACCRARTLTREKACARDSRHSTADKHRETRMKQAQHSGTSMLHVCHSTAQRTALCCVCVCVTVTAQCCALCCACVCMCHCVCHSAAHNSLSLSVSCVSQHSTAQRNLGRGDHGRHVPCAATTVIVSTNVSWRLLSLFSPYASPARGTTRAHTAAGLGLGFPSLPSSWDSVPV